MAYNILNTNGTTLVILADGTVDQVTTSLDLIGKNVNTYGQYINNNFIKLLENFASTAGSPPRSPKTGQLWYDTTSRKLNIYDNGFKSISGATVSASQPNSLSSGDIWWDSANNQLKVFNSNILYTIGPAYPKSVGDNGWILPSTPITNTGLGTTQQVTLLKNYGQTIGAVSKTAFTVSATDSVTYFNTSTATVVAGLTILGDIQASGQMTNRYLSAAVDLDKLSLSAPNRVVSSYIAYNNQNIAITDVLDLMFPATVNTSTYEVGVPLGSDAKVVCVFSLPSAGTQVRRFRVLNQPGVGVSWQPYEIYSTGTGVWSVLTSTNVNVVL
jgi:hypothetical protein